MRIDQLFILIIHLSMLAGAILFLVQFSEHTDKPFRKILSPTLKYLLLGFLASPIAKLLQQAWSKPETKDLLISGTIALAAAWLLFKVISVIVDHITWEISGFVQSLAPINVSALGQTGNVIKRVFPDFIRTEKDLKISAYHEAGHALLYALFPEDRLSSLTASIKLGSGGRSTSGAVWSEIDKEPSLHTSESYLFARMLITLAGTEAEAIALGTRHDGCLEDSQKWMSQAKVFLACGFTSAAYFLEAEGDADRNINAEAINGMLRHQKQLLQLFFEINRRVLDELAELLLEKKELGKDDLLPYLQKVIFPAEFTYRAVV
jgi:hypothetical protein